ncbi:MAG: bifunctional DNA primase/polymerase [Hyphomicrobiaceae bacterium]|nr:bifunctional DNA primase/polymerase [Hyphomicrobiaceae bacterium]
MPVFADHAVDIARRGIAVIPLGEGRRPRIDGWDKWSRPASPSAVGKWARRFPDANVAIVPGLSKVMVVDVDDAGDVPRAEEIFGRPEVRVLTRRGQHLFYARADARLPGDLRRYGVNADIRTGNALVIAPPSVHESGPRPTWATRQPPG